MGAIRVTAIRRHQPRRPARSGPETSFAGSPCARRCRCIGSITGSARRSRDAGIRPGRRNAPAVGGRRVVSAGSQRNRHSRRGRMRSAQRTVRAGWQPCDHDASVLDARCAGRGICRSPGAAGDTLACRQGRVRLRGVDTPERGESGYRTAQQELRRRTPGGTVTVVPHHRDRHGRIVGDVYSRGQNVGRSMNADGYSKPREARR